MTIRIYTVLTLLFLVATTACVQQSGSRKRSKARDTSHYTKQAYIDLTVDSNYAHKFLESNPSYNAYNDYILNFYRNRDFHYAWINKDGLTEQAGNFINMMKNDAAYGIGDSSLIPAVLDTLLTREVPLKQGDSSAPRIELLLTSQFFAYGNKVWGGLTTDTAKDLEWFIPRKKIDMASLLDSMTRKPNNTFEEEEPVNRQYVLLKQKLKKLVAVSNQKWDSIKMTQKALKRGDSAVVIAEVKAKLNALGDLPVNDSTNRFDAALDTALRSFQDRMGLKVDGILKQNVLDALNVPMQQRIQKVLLNMERLRWVPIDPTSDHIVVNIPQFKMMVYDSGRLDWSCNVVVGRPGTSTVVFTKDLRYIVFSPYWNVPPGILSNEVLPGLKRGAGSYLARQNMEIVNGSGKVVSPGSINFSKYSGRNFPYIVRQKPGGKNSLGKVKFLFPNEYNIYLHDTPARYLFGEDKRSFSHGCIRVQEPKRLAMWLLRGDSSWTEQKIDEAMNGNKEKYVTIKDKIPVYIVYFTAFVDEKGRLNFRDDVYGHDAKLASTLFARR